MYLRPSDIGLVFHTAKFTLHLVDKRDPLTFFEPGSDVILL